MWTTHKTVKSVLFFVFISTFVSLFFLFDKKEEPIIISYTEEGFSPSEIFILPGEQAVFVNESDKEMWPASDPHPEHSSYTPFDALRPLQKEEVYKITFQEEGVYTFHDHISTNARGKIVVTRKNANELLSLCKEFPENKNVCWEEAIKRGIDEGGLQKGFLVFETLYDSEPEFLEQGCHWNAHAVGSAAYDVFIRGEDLTLTPATAYCGYGFYHGFMERLLREDPDLELAQDFCEMVDKTLSASTPGARLNCFHGIGHGFVEDPPPKETWGDKNKMLARVFKICPDVSDRPEEVGECFEGGYNAVVGFMEKGEYGLAYPPKSEFFSFCSEVPKNIRGHCYYELFQKILYPAEGTLEGIASILPRIDEEYRSMAVSVGAAGVMQEYIKYDAYDDLIHTCNTLFSPHEIECFNGIIGGIFAHGRPGTEYEKALLTCGSGTFPVDSKKECYTHIITSAKRFYDEEKIRSVCEKFPEEYKVLCY